MLIKFDFLQSRQMAPSRPAPVQQRAAAPVPAAPAPAAVAPMAAPSAGGGKPLNVSFRSEVNLEFCYSRNDGKYRYNSRWSCDRFYGGTCTYWNVQWFF